MLFLDTTMLVGAADRRDGLHPDGRALLSEVGTGRLGTALVSDFILDEAVTILGRRPGVGPRVAVAFAKGVLSSPRIRCLFVDEPVLHDALAAYARFDAALSFTDATTLVLMRRAGCETLYSHDSGFDRVPGIHRRTTVE